MEMKEKLNKVRGWLPKNPQLKIGNYTQSSQNPEDNEENDKPLTKRQTNALVALAVVNFIMLIISSSYLVIYLITPSI